MAHQKIRPFLKWPGNKYHILDRILSALPKGDCLVEPFAGSGAVFINSTYQHNIIAEQNQDVISLFCALQQEGADFIAYCQRYFTPENNCAERYYVYREQFNASIDSKERSALFLYLNRHGFNGLCRYNQKGIYNVPFGQHLKPYFPEKEMIHFYQKSQSAHFLKDDFRNTFLLAKPGQVIYCDPPYAPIAQKSNFTSYTGQSFGEKEQCELAALAISAANRGITVIISNHDTEFTRHQYRCSEIHSFLVPRTINCQGKHRAPVKELLAIFR